VKIFVAVRKRPLTKKELRKNDKDVVEIRSATNLVVKEEKYVCPLSLYYHLFDPLSARPLCFYLLVPLCPSFLYVPILRSPFLSVYIQVEYTKSYKFCPFLVVSLLFEIVQKNTKENQPKTATKTNPQSESGPDEVHRGTLLPVRRLLRRTPITTRTESPTK